jgi:hypothetical protein
MKTDLLLEPLVLLCPACGRQHIDEGDLALDLHVEHVCLHCKHTWSPRAHATVGVPLGTLSVDWLMAIGRSLGWHAAHAIDHAWARREIRPVPQPAPLPSMVATVPPPPAFGVPVLRIIDRDIKPVKFGPYRELDSANFDVRLPGDSDA